MVHLLTLLPLRLAQQLLCAWCSYFCVTTNLSKGDPSVHRAGPLWLLVRASMTIVGLVPPVFYEGDLLIDGG
jgi:lysophospholipid hydrolase